MKTNGVKKPTSSDVAALAGVSQASVSLILSGSTKVGFTNETKERVFAAAKQLGYQPPAHRKLKKRTSRLILVLIPTLTNQYYSELVQTLEQYSDSLGYRVLVCNTFRKQELEKYYLEQFTGSKISGIIYAFLPSFPREVERLSATTPLVLIGEKSAELPICSIELSNMRAGALLAEHLYRLGHRRVSFLSTPMNQMTLARRQRLEGLRQKLVECGQRDGEKVSVDVLAASEIEEDVIPGGLPYEFYIGRQLTKEFLEHRTRSTALVGANDMTATGIEAELTARGYHIPQDFSVCGFDNIFTGTIVSPPLTTIDHKLWARCRSAVDLIVEQNSYEDEREKITMMADKIEYAPQLVVRGSTGPAPAQEA
jgi:LacI family transcriptional regulator